MSLLIDDIDILKRDLTINGYRRDRELKQPQLSKLKTFVMESPNGVKAIGIFPAIDELDLSRWMIGYEENLRTLVDYFERFASLPFELHIIIGPHGIPLPAWFREKLEQLGISIIEHTKEELESKYREEFGELFSYD